MNSTAAKIAATIASAAAVALLVAYVGGRLWVQGAADQIDSEISSIRSEETRDQSERAEMLWSRSAEVQHGMSNDEVLEIMGQPDSTTGNLFHQWRTIRPPVGVYVQLVNDSVIDVGRERGEGD